MPVGPVPVQAIRSAARNDQQDKAKEAIPIRSARRSLPLPAQANRPAPKMLVVIAAGAVGLVLLCVCGLVVGWMIISAGRSHQPPSQAGTNRLDEEQTPLLPVTAIEPPDNPDPVLIKPPVLAEDRVVVQIPGKIDDVAVGGGGRFLILHLRDKQQLAIFDVNEARVVQSVPLPDDKILFTAGMDKLLILSKTKGNLIEYWDLRRLQRESEVPFPLKGLVGMLCLGSSSHGPLFVGWTGNPSHGWLRKTFWDLKTLKRLAIKRHGPGNEFDWVRGDYIRASADGRLFGFWGAGHPEGLTSVVVTNGEFTEYYEHTTPRYALPSPDGRLIYTGIGLLADDLKPIDRKNRPRGFVLPTCDANYVVSLQPGPGPAKPKIGGGLDVRPAIHLADHLEPIATFPDIADLAQIDPLAQQGPFSLEKRIHFVPQANVIVTIPPDNDRLVLHRFDLDAALEKSAIDYLIVTSQPLRLARKKAVYTYRVTVKSRKGPVKYQLDSGPRGMTISDAGEITWKVPADCASGENDVILQIVDGAGQTCFHTFALSIRD